MHHVASPTTVAVLLANYGLIGLLPRIFFRDGRRNPRWWATAAPFVLGAVLVVAYALGALHIGPTRVDDSRFALSALLSAASIALIAFAIGSHRVPLALWHQPDDEPVEIVTWGAYSVVRHPFYAAFLLTIVATALYIPDIGVLVPALWAFTGLAATARREERRLLASRLGSTYREYLRTTGRFVPGVGRVS